MSHAVQDVAAATFDALLADTHTLAPADVADLLSDHAARMGARSLVVYLIDYEQRELVPVPCADSAERSVLRVEGTLAGRAFAMFRIQEADAGEDARRLWIPLLDGTERLGVLEIVVPALADSPVDTELVAFFERYAHLAAQLILAKGLYGDVFELVRRRRPMSLAAELQWKLLPPLTVAIEGLVIAGMLEPAYEAGGDSFDYAVNASGVHLAIFDALGHGTPAAVTANVAVSGYRNGRRRQLDLPGIYATADEAVAEFGGGRHATAVLAHLDLASGSFTWIPAGHPPPLLLRRGRTVKTLDAPASTPLGIRLPDPPQVARHALEPGDQILFYTDGLTEARDADGAFFTTERLATFLTRASAAGLAAPETLRRLRHAVMDYQSNRLQDDATAVLVQWRTEGEKKLLPQTVELLTH